MELNNILLGGFYFFAITTILFILYIVVMGNMGWQFFKMNFLLKKRAGTIYLALLRTKRMQFWYGRFKTVHKWKDGSETKITEIEDRLHNTREPVVFMVEGYPYSIPLSKLAEGNFPDLAKQVTVMSKTDYIMGMERMKSITTPEKKFSNFLPLATLIMLIVAIGAIALLISQMNDMNTLVKPIIEKINSIDFNSFTQNVKITKVG